MSNVADPGLSVVVPAYNEAEALPAVLDELTAELEQLPGPWEVLVVDDGSSDGTRQVLASRRDVTALRHPRNRGY